LRERRVQVGEQRRAIDVAGRIEGALPGLRATRASAQQAYVATQDHGSLDVDAGAHLVPGLPQAREPGAPFHGTYARLVRRGPIDDDDAPRSGDEPDPARSAGCLPGLDGKTGPSQFPALVAAVVVELAGIVAAVAGRLPSPRRCVDQRDEVASSCTTAMPAERARGSRPHMRRSIGGGPGTVLIVERTLFDDPCLERRVGRTVAVAGSRAVVWQAGSEWSGHL
jgi:hypothetical protein